jgi:hypothetical protein
MPPLQSKSRPVGTPGLGVAVEAIRPSFDDLVSLADLSVEAAAGPEAFVALARRADSVGWTIEIAQEAIRQIAR